MTTNLMVPFFESSYSIIYLHITKESSMFEARLSDPCADMGFQHRLGSRLAELKAPPDESRSFTWKAGGL